MKNKFYVIKGNKKNFITKDNIKQDNSGKNLVSVIYHEENETSDKILSSTKTTIILIKTDLNYSDCHYKIRIERKTNYE